MLQNDWNHKSKRWGHPFHSICPYMDTFPPRLPHYFIQKFTHRDDVVLDPFCGRGTTPLQACIEGRIGIGLDANPFAFSLTHAKLCPPDPIDIRNRVDDLSNDMFFEAADREPDNIRMIFHEQTLRQLVFLKQILDANDPVDAFLITVLLGMLHGRDRGTKRSKMQERAKIYKFLSVPMPKRSSLSPARMKQHIADKQLVPPDADVFTSLRARIERICRAGMPQQQGRAWHTRVQDIRTVADPAIRQKKVKLIFTAPPGMRASRHGTTNWLRLWFLNEPPEQLDAKLDQHRKLKDYLEFMRETSRQLYQIMAPDSVCALVITDVHKRGKQPLVLAQELWNHLKKKKTRFQLADIIEDSEIENEEKDGNKSPIDRVLIMYKGDYQEATDHVIW